MKAATTRTAKTVATPIPIADEEITQMKLLFERQLQSLYNLDIALKELIPTINRYITSPALQQLLQGDFSSLETEDLHTKIIFSKLGKKPALHKRHTLGVLINELQILLKRPELKVMADLLIASTMQQIRQHKIAMYITIQYTANKLRYPEIEMLLKRNLSANKRNAAKGGKLIKTIIAEV